MSETVSNDQYADRILKALSTLQAGQCAEGIGEIVQLGGKSLDNPAADWQVLLNIVAGPGGLLDQGFVQGQKLSGYGGNVAEIAKVTITPAGRAHLREQEAKSPAKVVTKSTWVVLSYVLTAIGGGFLVKLGEWIFSRLFH
jgi:hypothetical protein